MVTCNGKEVRVSVTVQKIAVETPDEDEDNNDSVDSSVDSSAPPSVNVAGDKLGIIICVSVGVLVAGAVLTSFIIIGKKKKPATKNAPVVKQKVDKREGDYRGFELVDIPDDEN